MSKNLPNKVWVVGEHISNQYSKGWSVNLWFTSKREANEIFTDVNESGKMERFVKESQSIPITELEAWLENYLHKTKDSPVGIMLEDFQALIKEYEKNNLLEKGE